MIGFALIAFPFVLLGFVMLMGRVEDPMDQIVDERQIERFLDDANPAELDSFVREGPDRAVGHFLRRRRLVRRGSRRSAD